MALAMAKKSEPLVTLETHDTRASGSCWLRQAGILLLTTRRISECGGLTYGKPILHIVAFTLAPEDLCWFEHP